MSTSDIRSRAARDADLFMADEFQAIADALRSAKTQADIDRIEVKRAADRALDSLWQGYGRQVRQINSAVSASNMGTAGMRFQGLGDLASSKMQAEGSILGEQQASFMKIAQGLQSTIEQVRSLKLNATRKKGQLIGQLVDKYEADARAEAEARRNYELNLRSLGLQEATSGYKWNPKTQQYEKSSDISGMSDAEIRAAIADETAAARAQAATLGQEFDPAMFVEHLATKYGTDPLNDLSVWRLLYGADARKQQNAWFNSMFDSTYGPRASASSQQRSPARPIVYAHQSPYLDLTTRGRMPGVLDWRSWNQLARDPRMAGRAGLSNLTAVGGPLADYYALQSLGHAYIRNAISSAWNWLW